MSIPQDNSQYKRHQLERILTHIGLIQPCTLMSPPPRDPSQLSQFSSFVNQQTSPSVYHRGTFVMTVIEQDQTPEW